MHRAALAALVLALSACAVERAVTPGRALPKERATECDANCTALGMRLSAMVLIMNSAGCVCEPKANAAAPAPSAPSAAVLGAATGVAAVTAHAEEQQTQETATAPTSAPPSLR